MQYNEFMGQVLTEKTSCNKYIWAGKKENGCYVTFFHRLKCHCQCFKGYHCPTNQITAVFFFLIFLKYVNYQQLGDFSEKMPETYTFQQWTVIAVYCSVLLIYCWA